MKEVIVMKNDVELTFNFRVLIVKIKQELKEKMQCLV